MPTDTDSLAAFQGKRKTQDKVLGIVKGAAVPVALTVYLVRRWLKHRKEQKGKPKPAAQQAASTQKSTRKVRRDYKVKRDELGPVLAQDGEGDYPHVTEGDDTVEMYQEDEVEAAGAAAAGGAPPNQMIEMLKQMGFRMVMDKNTGQVYMVPPGAKAPIEEEEGIAEGDEEGYDEDEDEE